MWLFWENQSCPLPVLLLVFWLPFDSVVDIGDVHLVDEGPTQLHPGVHNQLPTIACRRHITHLFNKESNNDYSERLVCFSQKWFEDCTFGAFVWAPRSIQCSARSRNKSSEQSADYPWSCWQSSPPVKAGAFLLLVKARAGIEGALWTLEGGL